MSGKETAEAHKKTAYHIVIARKHLSKILDLRTVNDLALRKLIHTTILKLLQEYRNHKYANSYKLTPSQIVEAKKRRQEGDFVKEISNDFGVSVSLISRHTRDVSPKQIRSDAKWEGIIDAQL